MSYCVTPYVYLCHWNVHLHNWGWLVLYTREQQGQNDLVNHNHVISYTIKYVLKNTWINSCIFSIVISIYLQSTYIYWPYYVKQIDKWRVYRLSDYMLIKYSSLHAFIRLKWENIFCSCKVHFITYHDQSWKKII